MMPFQIAPSYPHATGKIETPIVNCLIDKYGYKNISWPIILSKDNETTGYLFERNIKNKINSDQDNRPKSSSGIMSYFLDYTCSPRTINPEADFLIPFLNKDCSCSYDYVTNNPGFSTVDLDYVWKKNSGYRGFELTTFWVNFDSQERASTLVSKMKKRPSWQGQYGPRAFRKIVDCSADLEIDYYLVCVNTVNKTVGSDINTSGNVYFFRLNHEEIDRLDKGYPPENSQFCSFEDFLSWL